MNDVELKCEEFKREISECAIELMKLYEEHH
jgi:hypothetical protein